MPIVGMLSLTKITCNPYASVPEKRIDDEITSDCKPAPELRPNPFVNARGEDCIGEARSRQGKHFRHSAPYRIVPKFDSALEYKY